MRTWPRSHSNLGYQNVHNSKQCKNIKPQIWICNWLSLNIADVKKTHSYSHHPYCCYVYIPSTNPFAHPSRLYYYLLSPIYCFCTSYLSCTFLYPITLFYSLFLFFTYIYIYIYIYALVWCYFYIIFILCTVHWADLIWFTFHFWLYPV